jgi:peptide/nickel transport system permease protein
VFSYLVKRMFQSVFVMLAVSLISFVLFTFVGDPVSSMVGRAIAFEAT